MLDITITLLFTELYKEEHDLNQSIAISEDSLYMSLIFALEIVMVTYYYY